MKSIHHNINDLLTIVIVSYKSSKTIEPILNRYSHLFKIIIIENSRDKNLRKKIKKKYKKTRIYFKDNVGYGCAINYASKYIKTKYFFAINPDLKFNLTCLKKLLKAAEKLKGNFGSISPLMTKKNNFNKKEIELVKSINGSAMFFVTNIFKKLGGFDKNIWLFFEENDLCKRILREKYFIYNINSALAYHSGGKSMDQQKNIGEYNMLLTKYWHGQWSRYYFCRKHFGAFKAILIIFPKFTKLIFQLMITFLYNPKKSRIYFYQLYGSICSIIGTRSFLRPRS